MRSLVISAGLIAMMLISSTAHAACLDIPNNKVWGSVSNAAIARYVETQFGGNWEHYVEKWQTRLSRIEEVASKGAMLVFHDSGLWLRGDDLNQYLRDVRTRLSATKCMAASSGDDAVPGEAFVGVPVPDGGS